MLHNMVMPINRREWIQRTAALGATGALPSAGKAVDFAEPVPEAKGLTAYVNDSQALFRWNNMPLCVYRAHPSQKRPYFHPLAGPLSGLPLTAESALPYPHHRGVWLGLDPLNGGNYWGDGELSRGHIRSSGPVLVTSDARSAVISASCEWSREGAGSPFSDQRRFTIVAARDDLWYIDADITMTAGEDVEVQQAKHSLFAIRVASDISPTYGGVLENSHGGQGAEGTYGKTADWCGYHGKRRRTPSLVEGLAVMEHPENPWAPCPWFTRDYGHLSPSPFNFLDQPWRIEKGQSIRMRYRIVAHAGSPAEAGLSAVFDDWRNG